MIAYNLIQFWAQEALVCWVLWVNCLSSYSADLSSSKSHLEVYKFLSPVSSPDTELPFALSVSAYSQPVSKLGTTSYILP